MGIQTRPRTSTSSLGASAVPGEGVTTVILLLTLQLSFATFPVAGKTALSGFSAFSIATWRVGAGGAALLALAFLAHGAKALLPFRDLGRAAALGLLGVTGNQLLFILGLQRTTAVTASLVLATIPVATYGCAVLWSAETWDRRRGAGILCSGAGCALFALARGGGQVGGHVLGLAFLVGNCFCYALYLVLVRPLVRTRPPLAVTAWVFVTAIPSVLLVTKGADLWPMDASTQARFALLWVVVIPTMVAYALGAYLLTRVPASPVAAWTYVQPLITLGLAVVWLGERPGVPEFLGGGLILSGLFLVDLGRRRQPPRSQTV